ncbi:MAG: hypothetical protein HUK21_04910 [Fibrobacteraceae bacterium]|nr:hypothetical protein [Fibrobacteraceae bacterium]
MKNLEIAAAIKRFSPLMDESSEIFRELVVFFGDQAKIPMDTADLQQFLGRKRLYRIIRISGKSFKECALQLVDDYPEVMESLGMLRYYICHGEMDWAKIEEAETAMGNELSMNAYGWAPDAWTAFESQSTKDENPCQMVALIAFSIE